MCMACNDATGVRLTILGTGQCSAFAAASSHVHTVGVGSVVQACNRCLATDKGRIFIARMLTKVRRQNTDVSTLRSNIWLSASTAIQLSSIVSLSVYRRSFSTHSSTCFRLFN
jgi:hypothetical protein